MKVRILGCGVSGGVPYIGNIWGRSDPNNPYNKRLRASILLTSGSKNVLIDSSPDLRQQLLAANVKTIDTVVYTHAHADHLHGINDLCMISRFKQALIPIYADHATLSSIRSSFAYALPHKPTEGENPEDMKAHYSPFLTPHVFQKGKLFTVSGLEFLPIEQDHGFISSFGFRIGDFSYSTDVRKFSPEAFDALKGTKTWVVDCLSRIPHKTHSHLRQTLEWIDKIKPRRAYLTHMSPNLDYNELLRELPRHVLPCYDGLEIEV